LAKPYLFVGARRAVPLAWSAVNKANFTQYFLHPQQRSDRKDIRTEWIQYIIDNSMKEEKQADGRIRRWAKIREANNKYLRVILLEDGETIHNAFFDRSFEEEA